MGKVMDTPFRPGPGESPPLLVGRQNELLELTNRLERTRKGEPGGIVALHGSRGNGKTALLAHLETMAKKKRIRSLTLISRSEKGGDPDAPWQMLGDLEPPKEITTQPGFGLTRLFSRSRETKTRIPAVTPEDLPALARKKPVLLVVDEAHELPAGFGQSVLHVVQYCVRFKCRLLAVFAGSPALPGRFQSMSATFWERAKRLEIGRLGSDDEVREALTVPASRAGRSIDADALELLVRESQRYPFFVQLLGAAAWKAASARDGGGKRITVADVRAGLAEAGKERAMFYADRRREFVRHKVLAEAEAVSKEMVALKEGESLSWQRLADALDGIGAESDSSTREAVKGELAALGLICETPESNWDPGIPSLCAYLVKNIGRR